MQQRLENLTASIEGLEREVGRLRNEFRRRTLAIVGVVAIIALVGILFARNELNNAKQIAENNRHLCPVITVLANPSGAPATTARGVQIQQAFAKLSNDFGCR